MSEILQMKSSEESFITYVEIQNASLWDILELFIGEMLENRQMAAPVGNNSVVMKLSQHCPQGGNRICGV